MFNWLGTWLGNWFGSSEPAPVGAMSGSASFSLSTSATLTSTGATTGLMMGAASLSISTTATGTVAPVQPATGNFWSAEFWADGFWSYGFWGVFEQPYTELKPNLKLFVRTELHKLFVQFEVEQIIAVAELNSLSVLDAASALSMAVRVEGSRLLVAHQPLANRAASALSIFTRDASLSVLTEPDELFVRQGATESVVRVVPGAGQQQ